jgi:predicted nucleic acid-binding protein
MKYFVATSILVDLFAARERFVKASVEDLSNVKSKNWVLYVSDHSMVTLNCLTARHFGNLETRKKTAILINQVELVAANKSILFAATSNEFKNYEDALSISMRHHYYNNRWYHHKK